MSPSVDCVASLYCAEDVSAATWGDEDSGKCAYLESVSELQPTVFLDFSVEDDDAVSTLLLKEAQYMPEPDYSERYHSRELSNGARLDAVRWIQKAFYNYSPLTVALAVNYMDRFLSRHHLPEGKDWMLQLLSVSCISLAAKMEESEVPILLDLQVEQQEHIFEAHTIQRMELLVLSTLEWRMSVVTPFSYIDYFFHKLGISELLLRALLSRVSEIIMKAIEDTTFLQYLPSVVAAASLIFSLEEVTALHTDDLIRIFSDLSVDVDAIKDCYHDMQVAVMDPYCQGPSLKRKALRGSEPQSPIGVLEAAALSSATEGTLGFSSRESSPGICDLPPSTFPQRKRRKLSLDDDTSTLLERTHL
ncbi:cyclin-D4-2 isoform X2 [Physcomitrium patens]|uniref:cyclin-D4-2 isoform X2 n=1 Tax=Physcomitrium patens TaxID=3218 RepID=UPI000D165604|nr:cyclin-D4-2-like isoform X2 [Physcomitrium patens]|eukprot:XP_024383721.1 cyclin-D4-2-like isoform X2 [Physcomitrella patens]